MYMWKDIRSGFESQLSHLIDKRPWAVYFTFLSLSFLKWAYRRTVSQHVCSVLDSALNTLI